MRMLGSASPQGVVVGGVLGWDEEGWFGVVRSNGIAIPFL